MGRFFASDLRSLVMESRFSVVSQWISVSQGAGLLDLNGYFNNNRIPLVAR